MLKQVRTNETNIFKKPTINLSFFVEIGEFIRNLVSLESGGSGGVVWRIRADETRLVCAVGSRNGTEETKLLVLDFDIDSKWNEQVILAIASSLFPHFSFRRVYCVCVRVLAFSPLRLQSCKLFFSLGQGNGNSPLFLSTPQWNTNKNEIIYLSLNFISF